jgi:hypothetical protein
VADGDLRDQYLEFGAACARDGGLTYQAICQWIADDPELLAMTATAPAEQRRPNLLLAAVHFLLLEGAAHQLALFYDTVRPEGTEPTGEVGPAFHDFCLTHRDQILVLMATRSTQTNEVRRCTVLLPALCEIARRNQGAELALIDLGTSAGLNLLFDRYGYRYQERDGTGFRLAGDAAARVQLECFVPQKVTALPDLTRPNVGERVGLDLHPIDANDDDQSRWLLACLWPDQLPRFERLRAALETWREAPNPPRIVQGDMVDDLAGAAATIAGRGPLIVFHSWAVAYLPENRQRALAAAVMGLNSSRPTHHLFAEQPREVPGLPVPESPHGSTAATALVHIDPTGKVERWADVHPHGNWIRWYGSRDLAGT